MRERAKHRRKSATQMALLSSPQRIKAGPAFLSIDCSVGSPEDWSAERYETASLPDARLKRRLIQITADLARKPSDSINQACEDWASAKGAYRFIENERVTIESLQEPIAHATARDCAGYNVVFAVQDTTTLSFAQARQATGLGPVNDSPHARGMLFRSACFISKAGVAR